MCDILYICMFLIIPTVSKGILINLTNENYSDRMSQFTNYIYDKHDLKTYKLRESPSSGCVIC